MKAREEKLQSITTWGLNNPDVVIMLLTSSLVNPLAPIDGFSDLDIEIIFKDNSPYILQKKWLLNFGIPLAIIEEDEQAFEHMHAMKMVLYDDEVKVDFKLFSLPKFEKEINKKTLHPDWDIGYKVLFDKSGITSKMAAPTYLASIIKKPNQQEFENLIYAFWWDTTYVAKCLKRGDIFYAKFMSESVIRTEYLTPLIEWYIAEKHDFTITTNKHGRLFKKYLPTEIWNKIEKTFSAHEIPENWSALFAMADLVSQMGRYLAIKLNYIYPTEVEKNIRNYLLHVKNK
ncbi:MAG: AadS family aminoglycoside 6-adenylyltransferase [Flavobacteriaceae bacterium]|nr:AadS family aminoglycoside 6-adenylyltransferase [Flavobacteriaceae bacterium]